MGDCLGALHVPARDVPAPFDDRPRHSTDQTATSEGGMRFT